MSDDRMIFKPAKCAGYITAFINVDVFLELRFESDDRCVRYVRRAKKTLNC